MIAPVEFRPPGSDRVLGWAAQRGLGFALAPDERWFRDWEPFDTMVAPEHWLVGVTERSPWGTFVVAEAWTATLGVEPIERTIVGFAQVATRGARASLRVGEPFLTRVAFLTTPPPNEVELGDPTWDAHVKTFAASPADAAAAFPTALRELLRRKGFRGHLEVRPGGFVVHHEGFLPTPEHYDATFRMMHRFHACLVPGAIR